MRTVQKLTLDDARVMMTAAEAKAREIGVDMDIAITDDNGSLLMFHRMDGGRITSIDVAISPSIEGHRCGPCQCHGEDDLYQQHGKFLGSHLHLS